MNLKEMNAVNLTLQSSLIKIGSSVGLFSDITIVQALRRQDSSKSLNVTWLVAENTFIFQMRNIQIHPHKCAPRKLNVLADALSRSTTLPGEWTIQEEDRERLRRIFPFMEADLMPADGNSILEKFVPSIIHRP